MLQEAAVRRATPVAPKADAYEQLGVPRRIWRLLRGGRLSPTRAAFSLFVGVFIGCQPVFGLHFVLCLIVCLPLRLDFVLAYLAANVSNPFVAPFLVFLELEVGAWLLFGVTPSFDFSMARDLSVVGLARQVLVGAQLVGLAVASVAAGVGYVVTASLSTDSTPSASDDALRRTVARYAACRRADRSYVAAKLRLDPLTLQLERFDEPLGVVLDVGCGRGQFSLYLAELGRSAEVVGFDWDPRKVSVARAAAGRVADYRIRDASDAELPECDTILLIDVLHYLTYEEQDRLLQQCKEALRANGRLLVRELDATRTWSSRMARWFERVATRSGYNRARQLSFRSQGDLVQRLEELGFTCETPCTDGNGPNLLVVARRAPQLRCDFSAEP